MGGGNSKTKNNRQNKQMQSSYGPSGQEDVDDYDDVEDQMIQGYQQNPQKVLENIKNQQKTPIEQQGNQNPMNKNDLIMQNQEHSNNYMPLPGQTKQYNSENIPKTSGNVVNKNSENNEQLSKFSQSGFISNNNQNSSFYSIISNETAYKDKGEVMQAPVSKEEAEIKLKENIKDNPVQQPKAIQKNFVPNEVSSLKAKEPENFNIAHNPLNTKSQNKASSEPSQIKASNNVPNQNNSENTGNISKQTPLEQDAAAKDKFSSSFYSLTSNDTQYHENSEIRPQDEGGRDKQFQLKQNIQRSPFMGNPYKKDFPLGQTEKLKSKDPERFHKDGKRLEFSRPVAQTDNKEPLHLSPKEELQPKQLIKQPDPRTATTYSLTSHESVAHDEGRITQYMEKSNEGGFNLKEQIHGTDEPLEKINKQPEYSPPKKLEFFDPIQANTAEQRRNNINDAKNRTISNGGVSGDSFFTSDKDQGEGAQKKFELTREGELWAKEDILKPQFEKKDYQTNKNFEGSPTKLISTYQGSQSSKNPTYFDPEQSQGVRAPRILPWNEEKLVEPIKPDKLSEKQPTPTQKIDNYSKDVQKGAFFNVQRPIENNKTQMKSQLNLNDPLIRNISPTASFVPDITKEENEHLQEKESILKPSMNWEPVILKKREKLGFHPEFDSYHKAPIKDDIGEEVFVPQYRLEQAKQDFISEMENLDKDPAYKRINIAFVKNGPDGDGRRVFPFHVKYETGTILDLKRAIMNDFGYQISQQRLFRRYLELDDNTLIAEIPDFEEEEVLIFAPIGLPLEKNSLNFRNRIGEKGIEEIMELNCSNLSREEYDSFISEENLVWPPSRNWTKEWIILYSKIRELKKEVEVQESLESFQISQLMQIERELYELLKAFETIAKRIIHNIYQWRINPTFLDNMHGKGGKKFVAGGMVIRECRNWMLLTQDTGEGELSYKIACNEHRAVELIRGVLEGIEVPLSCMIVHNGVAFVAQSLCPISKRSLVYGSNTEGIEIVDEEEAKVVADTIARFYNIKEHIIYDRVEKKGKYMSLAFDSEIHFADDGLIYFMNPIRIFAPDINELDDIEEDDISIYSRVFRPEFQKSYSTGEPNNDFLLVTWQNPIPCSECGEIITDYDYFYYEKCKVDKNRTQVKQYYCCIRCYVRLQPYDGFKVPSNKIVKKTLPPHLRKTLWVNAKTGEITEKMPMKLIPLNPDAYVIFPEFTDGEDREYLRKENGNDQEEIQQTSQRLRDVTILTFVQELNNMDIVPNSSASLTEMMHSRGINMRYLGRISLEVKHNFVRELVVREALARSIKVLVRDGQSFLKDQVSEESGLDAKKLLIQYLNEIFTAENRPSSKNIWTLLSELTKKKFNLIVDKQILQKIHVPALINMVSLKLCITFNKIRFDLSAPEPFSVQDLIKVTPFVKMKTEYSQSVMIALKRAREKDKLGKRSKWFLPGGPERAEATEFYRQAAVMAEFIYGEESKNTFKIFKEFAEHLEQRHAEKGRPEYSRWNKCANIPEDNLSADSRFYYQKCLNCLEKETANQLEIAEVYIALARLHKETNTVKGRDPLYLSDIQFKYLLDAIYIYEYFIGVDHPDTAHLYMNIGFAYKEKAKIVDQSITYINVNRMILSSG